MLLRRKGTRRPYINQGLVFEGLACVCFVMAAEVFSPHVLHGMKLGLAREDNRSNEGVS